MHDRAIAFPLAALLSLASTHSVPAQAVLETPTRRIEFIGLKRWTIPMIRDSLARYAPGDSLTGHACAVVLRQSLKFADASVISSNRPDSAGRVQTVITVIEPQDSALVRYRREAADSLAIESHYAAAIKAFKAHPREFQRAIQDSAFLLARRMPAAAAEVAWRLPLEPVRRMLVTEATPRGRARALRVLARDRNPFNRSMAILVVSTAPGFDSTWWTLADELRYPNGFAAGTAEMAQIVGVLCASAGELGAGTRSPRGACGRDKSLCAFNDHDGPRADRDRLRPGARACQARRAADSRDAAREH